MLTDALSAAPFYLLAIPVAATPIVWVTSHFARRGLGWFVTSVLASNALLASWLIAEVLPGAQRWSVHRVATPVGLVDVGLTVTTERAIIVAVIAVISTLLATFSWDTVTPARASSFFLSLLLATVAFQGAILATHPLTALAFLSLADVILALAIAFDLTNAAGRVAIRMFATTQIAILLVVILWWAPIGEVPRDNWGAVFADSHWAIVGLAAFWALRAGVAPLQTWLTPALNRSPGPRASVLILASLGVGGLLLTEVAAVAQPVWPGWTTTMVVFGLFAVVMGIVRLLAQSQIHGAVTYFAVIQTGVLALAVSSGPPTVDLARSFVLIATIGLVVAYVSGTAIEHLTERGTFPAILAIVRREPLIALAAVIGLAITIGLPPFGTFDLRVSLVQYLLGAGSGLSAFARVLMILAIAASLTVPVLFIFRRLFGPTGEDLAHSGTLPASASFGLTALAGFAVGLAHTTKTIPPPPFDPGGIDWTSVGARAVLAGAAIIGFFLFLVEFAIIGRRQSALMVVRGGMRRLGRTGQRFQYAADRGLVDPLVRLPILVIGIARAAAFTVDFLLGRLTRSPGE